MNSDLNSILNTQTATSAQTHTTNALGLDPANPWTYISIAGIIFTLGLITYLIILTSNSNNELTKIRKLLEERSPTSSGARKAEKSQEPPIMQ